MIGAWRKRFEEEVVKIADTGEAAAAVASMPGGAKAAKPPAGRAIETEAADTPAKRVKEGKAPISPADEKAAADPSKATAVEPRTEGEKPDAAEHQILCGDPVEAGRRPPGRGQPTTPRAGTPPSEAATRRDGSESKPDAVPGKDDKSS